MEISGTNVRETGSTSFLLASVARRFPVRGRGWAARKLWARSRARGWWTVTLDSGPTVRLPVGSVQTWVAAFTGGYDDDLLEFLLPHFEPGTLALDIGASLGLYATRLAMRGREIDGQVIAFEPVSANRAVIRDNVDRNGLAGVVDIRPEALGDKNGVISLQVERGGAGNAAVTNGVDPSDLSRHASAGKTDSITTAELRRLDEIDLGGRRCSVIKLDVEGCEFQVLRGAAGLIARDRPVIQGEFNEAWLDSRSEDISWLSGWAEQHQYRFARFVRRRHSWWKEAAIILEPICSPVAGEMLLLPIQR
jgi:FkbM family methyltransferase